MSKRALLVGINYKGTSAELRGCIQDVENVRDFLRRRGYGEGDIVEMTDDTAGALPTRVGIIKALTDLLLSGATTLYFHYSGHGSDVRDLSRDEKDYKDECLVPIDYAASGMIIDDELRGVLQLLRPNQRLFAVLDCCHSGTGLDLRYGLAAIAGGRLQMLHDHRAPPRTRGQVVMMSGCLDSQTSADAWEEGEFQGAMTFSFLKAMEAGAKTYEELVKKVREVLKERGYSQQPTLTSGRRLTLQWALSL